MDSLQKPLREGYVEAMRVFSPLDNKAIMRGYPGWNGPRRLPEDWRGDVKGIVAFRKKDRP